ncbi:MAG: translation initiation factor eIF-1A [Nanoarchaeota archaeon]
MGDNFKGENNGEEQITRARIPRGGEIIGVIEQRLGGNKMFVDCLDGKKRNCRVPGRLKRALWLRPGDVVIIELWELDKNKGDIIFKYPSNQVAWLKKNKYLSEESKEF